MRLGRETPKLSAEINAFPAKTRRPAKFSATAFILRANRWIVAWQGLRGQKICANPMRSSLQVMRTLLVFKADGISIITLYANTTTSCAFCGLKDKKEAALTLPVIPAKHFAGISFVYNNDAQ